MLATTVTAIITVGGARNVPTFGVQHLEVVHGHLQDLCLLELGRALLLEGCGHQASQFCETRVDAIPTSFLNDAPSFLAT
jgi:hypothetical protein